MRVDLVKYYIILIDLERNNKIILKIPAEFFANQKMYFNVTTSKPGQSVKICEQGIETL